MHWFLNYPFFGTFIENPSCGCVLCDLNRNWYFDLLKYYQQSFWDTRDEIIPKNIPPYHLSNTKIKRLLNFNHLGTTNSYFPPVAVYFGWGFLNQISLSLSQSVPHSLSLSALQRAKMSVALDLGDHQISFSIKSCINYIPRIYILATTTTTDNNVEISALGELNIYPQKLKNELCRYWLGIRIRIRQPACLLRDLRTWLLSSCNL